MHVHSDKALYLSFSSIFISKYYTPWFNMVEGIEVGTSLNSRLYFYFFSSTGLQQKLQKLLQEFTDKEPPL